MKEVWKDVVGYEGIYKVSSFGRVKKSGCNKILVNSNHNRGYSFVTLFKNKRPKQFLVHRLVGFAFLGLTKDKEINHKDFDKKNNLLSNLEVCVRSENIDHAARSGKMSKNYIYATTNSTLSATEVLIVRDMYDNKEKYSHLLGKPVNNIYISRIFGISASCVSNIGRRKTWWYI